MQYIKFSVNLLNKIRLSYKKIKNITYKILILLYFIFINNELLNTLYKYS